MNFQPGGVNLLSRLLLTVFSLSFIQPIALGWQCRESSPIENLRKSRVAIIATITKITKINTWEGPLSGTTYRGDLKVEEVLKGPKGLMGDRTQMFFSIMKERGSKLTLSKGERWVIGTIYPTKDAKIELGAMECYNDARKLNEPNPIWLKKIRSEFSGIPGKLKPEMDRQSPQYRLLLDLKKVLVPVKYDFCSVMEVPSSNKKPSAVYIFKRKRDGKYVVAHSISEQSLPELKMGFKKKGTPNAFKPKIHREEIPINIRNLTGMVIKKCRKLIEILDYETEGNPGVDGTTYLFSFLDRKLNSTIVTRREPPDRYLKHLKQLKGLFRYPRPEFEFRKSRYSHNESGFEKRMSDWFKATLF